MRLTALVNQQRRRELAIKFLKDQLVQVGLKEGGVFRTHIGKIVSIYLEGQEWIEIPSALAKRHRLLKSKQSGKAVMVELEDGRKVCKQKKTVRAA